jgi:hypothetical protein
MRLEHLGFTGTQRGCVESQLDALHDVLEHFAPRVLHHGDCIGGDAQAHAKARELGIAVALHPPDDGRKRAWCTMLVGETTHTPRHFLDRNADIVFAAPVLVACPAEETGEVLRSGTWSTVRAARRRGRYIVIVRPSGRLEIERGVLMWEGGPPL